MKDLEAPLQPRVRSANPRIPPPVARAGWRARHSLVTLSFVLGFLLPSALVGTYMFAIARDQYVSEVSFVVRDDEATSLGLLAGLGLPSAGSATTDARMLYEYLRSPGFVAELDREVDLRAIYTRATGDPVFALKQDASLEELVTYWRRMATISVDSATGMIGIRIRAFDPGDARRISIALHDAAGRLVNTVSGEARAGTLRYAERDLAQTERRLTDARLAISRFRDEHKLMDPQAALNINASVIAGLSQELTEAIIQAETLREQGTADIRLAQVQKRIDVLRNRLREEQQSYVGATGDNVSFSAVLDGYTKRVLDLELAEKSYALALAGVEAARSKAGQDNRYLATFVQPSLPETATRPRRVMITALATVFIFIAWLSVVLISISNRDRSK